MSIEKQYLILFLSDAVESHFKGTLQFYSEFFLFAIVRLSNSGNVIVSKWDYMY